MKHVDVVEETLSRIGAGGVPRIVVLNQVDRLRDPLLLRFLEDRLPQSVRTSAVTGEGLEALRDAVSTYVSRRHVDLVIEADPGDGRLLSGLRKWGEVGDITYEDSRVVVRLRVAPRYVARIRAAGGRILHQGAPEDDLED